MGAYDAMIQPVSAAAADGQGAPRGDSRWRESARASIGDLFQRCPSFCWADLLSSACGAWLAATVPFRAAPWSPVQLVALPASPFLSCRARTFSREIVHMPMSRMTWVERAWNLRLGTALLEPWMIHRKHTEHHEHEQSATPGDGENLPHASSPIRETIEYLAQSPLLPLCMLLRFGVATPVARLQPKLRERVSTNLSAAVSKLHCRERFPRRDRRYRALHRILPALPYAAMGEAHRRLMAGLQADSPHRGTCRESFLAVVRETWQSAGSAGLRRAMASSRRARSSTASFAAPATDAPRDRADCRSATSAPLGAW